MYKRFNELKKIKSSYDNDVSKAISLITYDLNNVTIAGTSKLKSMIYSSDVDLFEVFNRNYSSEDIAKALQHIIKKIEKEPKFYIMDIKAGINEKFNIFHKLGYFKNGQIYDFDYHDTEQKLNYIKNDIDNYDELYDLCQSAKNGSLSAWLDLREKIRKLFTIRWTPNEILDGYKYVNNQKFYLYQAIPQFVTKIDCVFDFNGILTEISNILISYQSEKNGLNYLPIASDPDMHVDAVKYNIIEYLHGKHKNYLKVLKRIYSMAVNDNDNTLANKIAPILVSNIALLSKVSSILATLIDMLEKLPHPPMNDIRYNIDQCRSKLSNIYQFPFNEKHIDNELIRAQNMNKDNTLKCLENIKDLMSKIINSETLKYIKDNRLFPLQKKYLP